MMHAESPMQGTKTDHDTASFMLSLKESLKLDGLVEYQKIQYWREQVWSSACF